MMHSRFYASCGVAAVTLAIASPAMAQQRQFNIPAQPLASAIAALGKQAHLQIVAPADGIEGVQSKPLRGAMDARAALRALIAGTPLEIYSDDGARIVLRHAKPRDDRPIIGQAVSDQSDEDVPASAGADVVVTGYRASLQTARAIKQHSDAILDVVAAEDIGQLPDNSATEALARLPGVEIFRNRGEGQAITIRGISDVVTTLDGAEAYTGSSRRTLLNSYPAGIIGSLEVYKALTPDLVEGAIGGEVNVQLRQPFDLPEGIKVAGTLRGSYDDQARKPFYNGDLLVSGHWQTGIGEIGVLVNASYLRRDYLESYREDLQPQVATGKIAPTGLGSIEVPTGILVKHPVGYYERPVVTGELQWRPANNLLIHARVTNVTDINKYTDNDFQTNISAATAFTNVVLVPGTNIVKSATFTATADSGPRSSYTRQVLDTTQAEFGADWSSGIARLTTNAVYTWSKIDTDQELFLLAFNKAPTINAVFQGDGKYGGLNYSYGPGVDLNDINQFHVRAYSDTRERETGNGLQWRTDLDLDTGSGFFRDVKVGFRYAQRSANFQEGSDLANLDPLLLPMSDFPGGTQTQIVSRGFYGDDATLPQSWTGYNGSLLGNSENLLALNNYVHSLPGMSAYFTDNGRPAYNPIYGFSGNEATYATYGEFKYGLILAGIPIDGIVGARLVNTQLGINGTQVDNTRTSTSNGQYIATYIPVHDRQNYVDLDPSISAVAHFTPQLQLRLAWTKTLTRPDFSQLNPTVDLTQIIAASGAYLGIATGGNPDLKPTRSENWDASLEYYFGRAGSASLALFRRDVNGFIVNTVVNDSLDSAGVATLTMPINAGKGLIQGVEVNASSFFTFLPGILHNFGASANYTYVDSHQDLPATAATAAFIGETPGISKNSFNGSLFYDDGKFRARVEYSIRSDFTLSYNLTNPANNLNWYPISRLDASATYQVTPNVGLTIDATNLLDIPQRAYWGTKAMTDRVYYEGRVFSAAMRFKF
jgi:TonB-dependent receptor